jgi:hypothetical protein
MNEIDKKIDKVWSREFSGKDIALKTVLSCIIKSRNNIDVEEVHKLFLESVQVNMSAILKLDTRWLISVLDTYADCGSDLERSNATMVSLMFNQIKILDTYLNNVADPTIIDKKLRKNKSNRLWDGMVEFNIHRGDMVENLISRIDNNLKTTPHIHAIWRELMVRMEKGKNGFSKLKKIHERGMYKL